MHAPSVFQPMLRVVLCIWVPLFTVSASAALASPLRAQASRLDRNDDEFTGLPRHREPTDIRVTFLGTTSFVIRGAGHTLIIDGFFSRPSRSELLGRIEPNPYAILGGLLRAGVVRADALFVSHTHYDHALDSATVAQFVGARLMGSSSLAQLASAYGLPPARVVQITKPTTFQFGRLAVRAIPWRHSPDAVFEGPIEAPPQLPARTSSYREGTVYSYLVSNNRSHVLIIPSANYITNALNGVQADTVFLSIGQLGRQSDKFIATYWDQTVARVGAKTVIPIHWDDFTKPLTQPLEPFPAPVDRIQRAQQALQGLADRHGVKLIMPHAYQVFRIR